MKSASKEDSKSRFIDRSVIGLGFLFASGRVLYNDPLSLYAAAVLDTLLATRPDLKGRFRVYTLKSTMVNAFTTNDGKIFITTGLMARVRYRSELAFILAHEVIHYLHEDAYVLFASDGDDEKQDRRSIAPDKAEVMLKDHYARSREQETRADDEGLELYRNSIYGGASPIGVYDALASSERTPYDHDVIPQALARGHIVPDSIKWTRGEDLGSMGSKDEADTLESTHPSINSRRSRFLEKWADREREQRSDSGHDDFLRLAQFQLMHDQYANGEYGNALISAAVLGERYEDPFIRKVVAKCLFAIASLENEALDPGLKFRVTSTDSLFVDPWSEAVYQNLHDMRPDELYRLAWINAYEAQRIDSADLDMLYIRCGARDYFLQVNDGYEGVDPLGSSWAHRIPLGRQLDSLDKNLEFVTSAPKGKMQKLAVVPLVMLMNDIDHPGVMDAKELVRTYVADLSKNHPGGTVLQPITSYELGVSGTSAYNDYSFLVDLLLSNHAGKTRYLYLDLGRAKELSERLGTRYAALSMVLFQKNDGNFKAGRFIVLSLCCGGPLIGALVVSLQNYSGYYETRAIDLITGELLHAGRTKRRSYTKPKIQLSKFKKTLSGMQYFRP